MLLLLAAVLAAALPAAAAQQDTSAWTVVADPRQLELEIVGPRQAPFDRPPPRTPDPALLPEYAAQLNLLQDVAVDGGPTPFTATSEQVGWCGGEGRGQSLQASPGPGARRPSAPDARACPPPTPAPPVSRPAAHPARTSPQYVATVRQAFGEGEGGRV